MADLKRIPDASLKLRAFLEGLEVQHIDHLLTFGQVGDFRRLGQRMSERIKEITQNNKIAGQAGRQG